MQQNNTIKKIWSGEGYHNHSQLQYQWATESLDQHQFRGTEQVLDIGCGDGKISYFIASLVPQGKVLGVDLSESMLTFAKNAYANDKNLQFEQQDAKTLPYVDRFDFIFSCACLQWIKDQKAAVRGIAKSLKKDGHFKALIPNPDRFNKAIRSTIGKEEWIPFFREYEDPCYSFTTTQYRGYLEEMELMPLSVELRELILPYHSREDLFNWLMQVLPLHWIPKERHELFVNGVVDELLSQNPQSLQKSGEIYLPMGMLFVHAQKSSLTR
jgi:trans-aconitate 2-methyltransferase